MTMTHRISRLGVAQTAKVMGALYFLFGIIFAVIFGLIGMVYSASGIADYSSFIFGGAFIVFMPIIYGVMGVISGLLVGMLYNLVAGLTGGLELDLTTEM